MTSGLPWPYDKPRPCAGCRHRFVTFGMAWCGLGRWAGLKDEARCDQWEPLK